MLFYYHNRYKIILGNVIMLKKVTLLCIFATLSIIPVAASPIEQGNIAVTVPLLTVGGIVGFGDSGEFSDWSFDDDGWISFAGTRQYENWFFVFGSPWSFGYFIIDGLEVGLNVLYFKPNSADDELINLGLSATYYLDMNGLMPFIGAGLTIVDITDDDDSDTAISTSVGAAYAIMETIAPYLALTSQTVLETGTHVDIDLGVKFMF